MLTGKPYGSGIFLQKLNTQTIYPLLASMSRQWDMNQRFLQEMYRFFRVFIPAHA